jgi:hypothetical protein
MKNFLPIALAITTIAFTSCEDDDSPVIEQEIEVVAPATYSFERNGESTVSFSGQTTRIAMAQEIVSEMSDFDNASIASLTDMFANENNPFEDAELNASDKSVKSKVAASTDYFSTNAAASAEIKAYIESHFTTQINEVFPAQNTQASIGVAGQIADGESTRYVAANGFEYNQVVAKSLIGSLMIDQMLNNYLGTNVLDAGTNVADNDTDVLVEGAVYTDMEHKWDEAFGYLFGNSADPANANATIGTDDFFLNRYLGRVEGDEDFAGIAQDVFDAFKLGRAAIVAKDYELRDEQAEILRTKISEVVGIRAVYYLQQGKNAIEAGNFGTAFHDLSEGFGFVYSLQFTRNPDTDASYLSREEVQGIVSQLTAGNGLWEVTPATLDLISTTITDRFDFTLEQAGS